MIIVEPLGGLANRMRVISSGLWLSNETQQDLKLIWNLNNALNCEFGEIFEPICNLNLIYKKRKYKYVKATNQEKYHKRILALIINKFINIDYCIKERDFNKLIWNNKINILDISKKNRNLYFQTCEEFGNNLNEILNFRPISEIQKKIDYQTEKFTEHTIGIHIRRSDNKKSIDQSPLELFIDKINYELKINLDANFFLATDDLNTEKILKKLFGIKIFTYKKELCRNTQNGIKDAVVDLYCLSKTKYIYGSYWSSYSDIAARIGQIKLITIDKTNLSL